MRNQRTITTIYCLKNPTDRNRIFYVGKTRGPLNVRLSGHLSSPSNSKMASIISEIKKSGKRPTIHELERCSGYGYSRERHWIRHYNKRKFKLAQYGYKKKKPKKEATNHFYW